MKLPGRRMLPRTKPFLTNHSRMQIEKSRNSTHRSRWRSRRVIHYISGVWRHYVAMVWAVRVAFGRGFLSLIMYVICVTVPISIYHWHGLRRITRLNWIFGEKSNFGLTVYESDSRWVKQRRRDTDVLMTSRARQSQHKSSRLESLIFIFRRCLFLSPRPNCKWLWAEYDVLHLQPSNFPTLHGRHRHSQPHNLFQRRKLERRENPQNNLAR